MFKEKGEIIFLAILVIVISAIFSGFGTYFLLGKKQAKGSVKETFLKEITLSPVPATEVVKDSSSSEVEVEEESEPETKILETENMSADTQRAAKALGDFYFHLGSRDHEEAVKLVDWQYVNEDLLESAFGITSGLNDRAAILEEICSQEGAKTKIRILSVKEPVSGEDVFLFRVNYLEEDGQVYVNSSHVGGQFINETEFVIEVVKKGEEFLVRTLPGMFVLE